MDSSKQHPILEGKVAKMIRLLESSLATDKLQKQIDKLAERQVKLKADLDKRYQAKQKKLDGFYKRKAKAVKGIGEAINKAVREGFDPEAVSVAEEILRKLDSMSLDDWIDNSKVCADRRYAGYETLSEDSNNLTYLNNRLSRLARIPAPEDDFYGRKELPSELSTTVNVSLYDVHDYACAYGEMVQKIYEVEQELNQSEEQLKYDTDQLEKLTSSDEYLNYAPPEFWDFVEKAILESVRYWKSQNWKAEEYNPQTGKTVVFTVTQKDIESWYEAAAKETIYRVSHKAGRIKEVRYMKLGTNLRVFDGTYVCENKTVTAQTIIAGGWNIQRKHTRVLIN